MEKLNSTARELAEISEDLADIRFEEVINKADQIEAVVNMAKAFIELIGNVPREREITDGYFAMLSVLDDLRNKLSALDDRVTNASRRLASII